MLYFFTNLEFTNSAERQLLCLVDFIALSWAQLPPKAMLKLPASPYGEMIDEIIATLLNLLTIASSNVDGLKEAVQTSLTAGLTVIPVDRFISAIQPVILSPNESVSRIVYLLHLILYLALYLMLTDDSSYRLLPWICSRIAWAQSQLQHAPGIRRDWPPSLHIWPKFFVQLPRPLSSSLVSGLLVLWHLLLRLKRRAPSPNWSHTYSISRI